MYRVSTLDSLPLDLNTNGFHFDTEIIMQLLFSGGKIVELPIPTFYGDEVCHVNGLRYAWDVMVATVKARLIRMVAHDPKFYFPHTEVASTISKFFLSLHQSDRRGRCASSSVVLDLGCTDGELAEYLRREKLHRVRNGRREDLDHSLPEAPWETLVMSAGGRS